MNSIGDIYYIAGLLEGEGCFYFRKCPTITLNMTDLDTVEKARSLMNKTNKIYTENPSGNRKEAYRLIVYGDVAMQWMMTIYPLMSIRRKAKIREIIQKWKEMPGIISHEVRSKAANERNAARAIAASKGISYEEARKILDETLGIH